MWVGFAGLILAFVFLMLLFPDGRLPSSRWRIVALAVVLGTALTAIADGFYPGLMLTHGYVENPLGAMGMIGQELTTYGSLAASKLLDRIDAVVGIGTAESLPLVGRVGAEPDS